MAGNSFWHLQSCSRATPGASLGLFLLMPLCSAESHKKKNCSCSLCQLEGKRSFSLSLRQSSSPGTCSQSLRNGQWCTRAGAGTRLPGFTARLCHAFFCATISSYLSTYFKGLLQGFPRSGIEPMSPVLAGGFFTTEPPEKPPVPSYI